ncbi:MAG TPA: hypothetical protein ENJ53_09940 [Phaeodactylibacter sp.]|nr:hypothetical protein [Phaeodactylibacter sp.]
MRFVDIKNKHNWATEELIAYDNASIAEQDERGKITAAEKKGKMEIAQAMKKGGEPIDKIIRYTNLTREEIDKL